MREIPKKVDDDEPVDIWPHIRLCGIVIVVGMAMGNMRLMYTGLFTLVLFLVFIAIGVLVSE